MQISKMVALGCALAALALPALAQPDAWYAWSPKPDKLVPYGQNLCTPVSPHCSQCKLAPYCDRVGVTKSR